MTTNNNSEGRPGETEQECESYYAEYCEGCGKLFDATESIEDSVEEPVHRVDIIEAIGPFEEVGETVATEEGTCECTGHIVKRYYAYPAGNVPEPGYDPDPDQMSGRDPDEEALIAMSEDPDADDYQEVREVPWLEDGDRDE